MLAILRGINVSGKNKILMAELKVLFEELGFTNVSTYIQSGNFVFDVTDEYSNSELERKIEQGISQKFALQVPVIVRSTEEWMRIIKDIPFIQEAISNPEKLYVTFFKVVPQPDRLEQFQEIDFQPDKHSFREKELFICYATRYSASKLNNSLVENKLKVTATTRNWKTILKLGEIVKP